jgi:hypothetical protein
MGSQAQGFFEGGLDSSRSCPPLQKSCGNDAKTKNRRFHNFPFIAGHGGVVCTQRFMP